MKDYEADWVRSRMDEIRIYHKELSKENEENMIDAVTWDDLEMDEVFLRVNNTKCFIGEQVLYRPKEIILYRKMDFPIEIIGLLIGRKMAASDAIEQQLLELREKQKAIQGSIDLCQKVIEDGAYEHLEVETYLNYVKEEEAKGKKFAYMDELLIDFAEFTQFNRIAGAPYIGWVFRNPWLNRLVMILWSVMWIAIPVIGVLDDYLKGDSISPIKVLFWTGWLLFFGKNFCEYKK